MADLPSFLKPYWPRRMTGTLRDYARAAIGAGLGILSTGLISLAAVAGDWHGVAFLIAPMGASAVILFCLPSSPLAQPWAILAGNTLAAIAGVFFTQLLPGQLVFAAALAMFTAIALMFALRCLHPPSGAVALTAVLGGDAIHQLGYGFVWWPVLANSALLILSAWLYHTLTGYRYPAVHHDHTPTSPTHLHYQFGFKQEDLQAALGQFHEVLDINPEQLQSLLEKTELIAWKPSSAGKSCVLCQPPSSLETHWKRPGKPSSNRQNLPSR